MKRNLLLAGIVVAGLFFGGCSTDNNEPTPTPNPTPTPGEKIAVALGAELPVMGEDTRISIEMHPGDGFFYGWWDDGVNHGIKADEIGIATNNITAGGTTDLNEKFTRNEDGLFHGNLTGNDGDQIAYSAYYPYGDGRVSEDGSIVTVPFEATRTQSGSTYNSQYDALYDADDPILMSGEGDALGTIGGKMITFTFGRVTSVVAFNFTGAMYTNTDGNDVPVGHITKVVLTADYPIAADNISYNITNGEGQGTVTLPDGTTQSSILSAENQSKSITMTCDDGTFIDPSADNAYAYFNIPEGNYHFTLQAYDEDGNIYTVRYPDLTNPADPNFTNGISATKGGMTGNKAGIHFTSVTDANTTSGEGMEIDLSTPGEFSILGITLPDFGLLTDVINLLLGADEDTTDITAPNDPGVVNLGAVSGVVETVGNLLGHLTLVQGAPTLEDVLDHIIGTTYVTVHAPAGIQSLRITSDNEGLVQLLDGVLNILLPETPNLLGDTLDLDLATGSNGDYSQIQLLTPVFNLLGWPYGSAVYGQTTATIDIGLLFRLLTSVSSNDLETLLTGLLGDKDDGQFNMIVTVTDMAGNTAHGTVQIQLSLL